MRDSMVFYRSFFEAIKELPTESKANVFEAVFEYGLNFNEVDLKGIDKTIFTLIKPQLDANIQKYNNGKKQKVSKREANDKQTGSKSATNVNDNVNVNVNDIINRIKEIDLEPIFMQLHISPELITKYRDEFISKLLLNKDQIVNLQQTNNWLFNWLKLQPKRDFKYLTTEEKERRQVPTDKDYIFWQDTYKLLKKDNQGYYVTHLNKRYDL